MAVPALPTEGANWSTWAASVRDTANAAAVTADIGTAGTATSNALRAAYVGAFIPQAFGALADGVHDDGPAISACIQAALAAAPTSNAGGAYNQGARVWLPAGRYRIATPVAVNLASATNTTNEARGRLSLLGEGDGHTVILGRAAANTYAVNVRGGAVTIEGMSVVGDGTASSRLLSLGADDGDARGFVNQFRVANVTFRDAGRFVNLPWAFDGQFEDCGFTNLASGGIGLNMPAHSTDNCNNIVFSRCHFEPAPVGGTLVKALGTAGNDTRTHAVLSFLGCHFETRSFGSRAVDLEAVARVAFVGCQITQNSDPGDPTAAGAAVAPIRLVNAAQVTFTSCSIGRGSGTGWPTKLLALGGRNPGLIFQSCFLYPGEGVANASKAAVWASDPTTAYAGGVTPFRSVGTNIADNTAAAIPDEIIGVVNPNTAADMWTQRFDPTTRRLVFGMGAAGGDWASGRADRLSLAADGGLAVGSYLASGAQVNVQPGAIRGFGFSADNNPGRRGFYLIAANDEGDAFALVYSSAQALWPISVGSKFAVGTADPAVASKYNVYLNGFDVTVRNRTAAAADIMVLPIAFI